jgi:hypothetical protein
MNRKHLFRSALMGTGCIAFSRRSWLSMEMTHHSLLAIHAGIAPAPRASGLFIRTTSFQSGLDAKLQATQHACAWQGQVRQEIQEIAPRDSCASRPGMARWPDGGGARQGPTEGFNGAEIPTGDRSRITRCGPGQGHDQNNIPIPRDALTARAGSFVIFKCCSNTTRLSGGQPWFPRADPPAKFSRAARTRPKPASKLFPQENCAQRAGGTGSNDHWRGT